jgi:hypothetical protein
MSDVKMFRMITGEDVIGNVLEENESFMIVDKPVQVILAHDQSQVDPVSGRPSAQVSFAPFLLFTKDKEPRNMRINVNCVSVLPYEPSENVSAGWRQIFGSGIILPKSSLSV